MNARQRAKVRIDGAYDVPPPIKKPERKRPIPKWRPDLRLAPSASDGQRTS